MHGTTSDDLDILTREELIEWLCWNDRNGCYRDDEATAEFGEILPYEEAYWIAKRQINQ
jgi:hypothetical protein